MSEELRYIVAIGASAGGVQALREMVANLPARANCCYVILHHQPKDQASRILETISKETAFETSEIKEKTQLRANCIYITTGHHDVCVSGREISVVEPYEEQLGPKPSLDLFFKSASEAFGEQCIAVVLSGTGNDGAYGITSVREAGGITIAQDAKSARFTGMRDAAVATGCVDLILAPEQIGGQLEKIFSTSSIVSAKRDERTRTSQFFSILQIVLAHTRVDFREYKASTIKRRIERRMTALGITDSEEYALYCRQDPDEIDALFKELLISVTRFLRNPEEFDKLKVPIRELCETRREGPIRVWVAGCATGEEVYTLAMLFAEALGGPIQMLASRLQIFATDIDGKSLEIARTGRYSPAALLELPDHFSEKYFLKHQDYVEVLDALKSTILFSRHNICQDPPYIKMDLICCRNVLIYFGQKLQNKVISRLHYSLSDEGYLFLGPSETLPTTRRIFEPINESTHIFRKRDPTAVTLEMAETLPISFETDGLQEHSNEKQFLKFDALAASLGQTAILVSDDFSLEKVYGDFAQHAVTPSGGRLLPTLDVLRPPLKQEAKGLILSAIKHKTRQIGVRHHSEDPQRVVTRLEAIPCKSLAHDRNAALLVINRWVTDSPDAVTGNDLPSEFFTSEYLKELDIELTQTRSALQQTIEKLERSNQSLQQLSEEMQMTNAELQKANEELGSSNEELQSTNEELITVNEELQFNSVELETLTAEHSALLSLIDIPVLVIDNSLRIVRASKEASLLFQLSPSMMRTHISHINKPVGMPNLVDICTAVVTSGTSQTHEITTSDTKTLLKIAPILDASESIVGATIVIEKASPKSS